MVDYVDKAREMLKKIHCIGNRGAGSQGARCPRALYRVLELLSASGINVEYLYAAANSLIVMRVDDPLKAARMLSSSGNPVINNTLEI